MGNQNKTLTAEQKSEKKKSIITTICVILAAVIVIGLVAYARLADSGVILRSKTAAKSENYEISGTMMAYYFNQNYQTAVSSYRQRQFVTREPVITMLRRQILSK